MYINRNITKYIVEQIKKQKIVILLGSRQVGKTTLLCHIYNNFFPENSLYLSLDNPDFFDIFESVEKTIDRLILEGLNLKNESFIFFDEFQHIPKLIPIIKYISDNNNIKFILTGSSSLTIHSQLKESLAGRKRVAILYPFSLKEIEQETINKISRLNPEIEHHIGNSDAYNQLKKTLIYGKMPKIYLEKLPNEKIEELKEIYNAYLFKDVRSFLKGEEQVGFNKLLKLLAFQSACITNFTSLSNTSGLTEFKVKEYINILEQTYILKVLRPFSVNIKGEILKLPKIYFYDNGIRNAIINNFTILDERNDSGELFENFVFTELISSLSYLHLDDSLYYWRTKAKTEVDFIIKNDSRIIPIEVKFSLNKAKAIPSLLNFMKNLDIKTGYVITSNFIGKKLYNNKVIYFKTIYDFIAGFQSIL